MTAFLEFSGALYGIKAIFVNLVTAHLCFKTGTAQMGLELHILCRTAR
jgi:hypothetical protein